MAFTILSKVFATTGAEPLSATSLPVARALVQTKRTNSNPVELGTSTLVSGAGFELAAPEADSSLDRIELLSGNGMGNNLNLSTVYAIGGVGEGLTIFYETY